MSDLYQSVALKIGGVPVAPIFPSDYTTSDICDMLTRHLEAVRSHRATVETILK